MSIHWTTTLRSAAIGFAATLALPLTAPAYAQDALTYTGVEQSLPTSFPIPKKVEGAKVTIAFLCTSSTEAGLAQLEAVKEEARLLGIELIVYYDEVSVDKQVTNMRLALAADADAIVLYPFDPKALDPSLKEAQERNIPVLAFDAVFGEEQLNPLYAATALNGRDMQAFTQVQTMAKLSPGAKVGVIGIGFPVPALQYWSERVQFWAKEAGLEVVGVQDNPTDDIAGGEQAMTGLLARVPEIQGVIAYNDPSALGAAAAARTAGAKVIAVGLNGGSDGVEGVRNGRIAATVQADMVGLGVQLLDAAYMLVTKQVDDLPKVIVRPGPAIDAENIDSVPTWEDQTKALAARLGQ